MVPRPDLAITEPRVEQISAEGVTDLSTRTQSDPQAVRWVGVENHVECSSACRASAVPCPYGRGRDALTVPCPYCGSGPLQHCTRVSPGKGRRRVSWFHPSRVAAYQEVSAA